MRTNNKHTNTINKQNTAITTPRKITQARINRKKARPTEEHTKQTNIHVTIQYTNTHESFINKTHNTQQTKHTKRK